MVGVIKSGNTFHVFSLVTAINEETALATVSPQYSHSQTTPTLEELPGWWAWSQGDILFPVIYMQQLNKGRGYGMSYYFCVELEIALCLCVRCRLLSTVWTFLTTFYLLLLRGMTT